MNRVSLLTVLMGLCFTGIANGTERLGLNAAELERLGVELQAARGVARVEIAAGPAEVVIPPPQQAIVSTPLSGVLSRLLVAEGDSVDAGQALAEVESADLLALQRNFVDAAAAAGLAETQLERDRGLHSDGIIAERRLQETTVTARAAATALDQARQQLLLAGMTKQQISGLLATQRLTSRLEVRAPFSATVVEQLNVLGAQVQSLAPVYRVADLRRLWLEVHVPQERADRVEPGMRVIASVDGRLLDAEVIHIGRIVDAVSQTVLVRGVVENPGWPLRVGQVLHARILSSTDAEDRVVVVPNAAVVRRDGISVVFVRGVDGLAAQPVEILADDGLQTYLRSGIDPGAEVVVSGVASLKSVWLANTEGEE